MVVTAVWNYHATAVTYDLTVADLHTYYVVAGDTPVLVHNSNCVTDLALGYADSGTASFAKANGFTDYIGKEYVDSWRGLVSDAIKDPDVTLHVNTQGFGADGFIGMAQRGAKPGAYATEEEMFWIGRQVASGERSWSSVNFYDANGLMPQPPEPDWGTVLPDAVRRGPLF